MANSFLRTCFVFLFSIGSIFNTQGSHLVVGEMSYKYLGGNNYEVTLTYYRDCLNGASQALIQDAPASISIYQGQNLFFVDSSIAISSLITLPPDNPNSCLSVSQANACISKMEFKRVFYLPPSSEAYTIINQRCCFSESIGNVVNPGTSGQSFYCKILPTVVGNTSAVFQPVSNTTFCANKKYTINTSAFDADGDSLSYDFELIDAGGSATNPKPANLGSTLPNILKLNYAVLFTESNPMPGISLNKQSGFINLNPSLQGAYAFCVVCHEWRNGSIINTVKRTFVYSIYDCQFDVLANMKCDTDLFEATKGKFCLANCDSKSIQFKNESIGALSYHWDFGVNGSLSDTSNAFEPSYTFSDTGTYRVVLYAYGANCTDSIVQNISISQDDLVADFRCSGLFCTGRDLQFTSNSSSAQDAITYWKWNFIHQNYVFSTIEENPLIGLNQGGDYHVGLNVYNSKGCTARKDSTITLSTLNVKAYDDASVLVGANVPLYATGADTFRWSVATNNASLSSIIGANTSVNTNKVGNVKVFVLGINNDGCAGQDSVNILVVNDATVFVPTGFTPNDDGRNDKLQIKLIGAELKYFRVYNRRGQKVFETSDLNEGWDGRLNGGKLGIDTYYWVACIVGGRQQNQQQSQSELGLERIVKGDVTLVR